MRNKIDIVKLRRNVCRESYYDFCQTFWHEVVPETPVWNFHLKVICDELQDVCERMYRFQEKEHDVVINVPPGSSKSTICSIMLSPWTWSRMPSTRMIGASFDNDLSLDLGNKSRRLVKSKLFRETFPELAVRSDQDTKAYYANNKGGERRATSTGANITGRHAHIIVIDDPINPRGVRSPIELRTANEWMREAIPSRCVNIGVTPIILVMQRLGIDDPTGMWLDREGGTPIRHICLPAELSDMVKPRKYRKFYQKGLLDPVRLSKRSLDLKKFELGVYGYAGQYEQRPNPLTGGMFDLDKLIFSSAPPPPAAFTKVVRHWDKAATQAGGAYTAGVLMGFAPDISPHFWVLNVIRVQLGSHARERLIKQTTETDHMVYGDKRYIVGLEQEGGSGGKDSAEATVANLAGYRVIVERPTGDKEYRADPFAAQVGGSNVALVKAPWNNAYLDEMRHFSNGAKYKDQIDASSGCFKELTKKKRIVGAGGF